MLSLKAIWLSHKHFATKGEAMACAIFLMELHNRRLYEQVETWFRLHGKTVGIASTDNGWSEFSAHLFKRRHERFRKLFGPFRFGEVREVSAPKGTGTHGVHGAVELRHDVPLHDVGQFVSVLMLGKCLFK